MNSIKPPKLNKGDVIGVIAPASSPEDITRIDSGVKYLESLGYHIELGKYTRSSNGYLAGKDEERAEDINYMFGKKDVKAIFCVRGGYGTPRILDKINYKLIKNNPKILVGYSDITALQMAIYRKTGLITFAGPMVAVDFVDEVSQFTQELFWALITSSKKFGPVANPENERFNTLCKGRGEAQLLGGNLSVLCSLMGTEYFPQFNSNILILEEIAEAPYRIDRMLNQLRLGKVFETLKGVILGRFVDCYESNQFKKSLSLNDVIDDYFGKFKIPVVYNFKHGHIKDNITIAFGVKYKINTEKGTIEITEGAVS